VAALWLSRNLPAGNWVGHVGVANTALFGVVNAVKLGCGKTKGRAY
jgi:hypothetical protein